MSDEGLIVLCWDCEKNIMIMQLNSEEPPSWYFDLPKSGLTPFYHMKIDNAAQIRFLAADYFALENRKGTYRSSSVQYSQLVATQALINIILHVIKPDIMNLKHIRDDRDDKVDVDEPPRKKRRTEIPKSIPPQPSSSEPSSSEPSSLQYDFLPDSSEPCLSEYDFSRLRISESDSLESMHCDY